MTRYLLKRLVLIDVTFVIITFLLFTVFCLVPGNPIMMKFGDEPQTPWQEFRTIVRLIVTNYNQWIGFTRDWTGERCGILQGNFGMSSYYGKAALSALRYPMANTIIINTLAALITLAITIPLGIYCAVHFKSKADSAVQTFTLLGCSIPDYLIALIFIYIFAVKLGIFPAGGSKTPGLLATGLRKTLDRFYYLLLPTICLVFTGMASMTRTVRAAIVDTLTQDYVKTARAKGLSEKIVIYSHAWRNALLPISTSLCNWIIGIFSGGSLVIETTFSLVGTGTVFWNALRNNDYQLVLCLEVFYVAAALIGKFLTDLVYTLADPRIRLNK